MLTARTVCGGMAAAALQLEYSLIERTSEGELIPMAKAMGMGVLPWSPLKSGFLSGKYASGETGKVDTARAALVGVPTPPPPRLVEGARTY